MSGGRSKCRAITDEPADGRPRSCRALTDCICLVFHPNSEHPDNPRFLRVGLCKVHTRQWIEHIENDGPPVRYKPHRPTPIEDLS